MSKPIQCAKIRKNIINLLSAEYAHRVVKVNQYLQQQADRLTFTTLWAFSADDKMMLFFLLFPENRVWHFMQIVSLGDNLHEMSNPVFWEK